MSQMSPACSVCHAYIEKPEDKRSKLLSLTEYAEIKRNEFIVLANSIEKEITDDLSESDAKTPPELLMKVI